MYGACIVYGNDYGVFVMCVCVFPESSLTPENLSTVLAIMEDSLWEQFGLRVNIPNSELDRIKGQYSSEREQKQAVIPYLISNHPSLSWTIVACALYQIGYDSCHRALECLQQLFPTGKMFSVHIIYSI